MAIIPSSYPVFSPLKEERKQISNWPYDVSTHGRIRRITGGSGTYFNRILKPSGIRYNCVTLRDRHRKAAFHVHRLVAQAFLPPKQSGMQVNHINGDKRDNRLCNLEYVTGQRNMDHAVEIGLLVRGQAQHSCILTPDQVYEIRDLLAQGIFEREIAQRFEVKRATIHGIRSGKNWKHLPEKPSC